MGYSVHNAIVVTGFDEADILAARESAGRLGLDPSPVMASPFNGFLSFFVPPDGSNEGREDSNDYDEARETYRGILRGARVAFVEVCYGDDSRMCEASVVESTYSARVCK